MTPKESLQNVREAHRLLYAFQECMRDFAFKVKHEVMGNKSSHTIDGLKHISKSLPMRKIGKDHNEVAFSAVNRNCWAWDFIPTYAYEYYLGEFSKYSKQFTKISLIQIADDAVYNSVNGIVMNEKGYTEATIAEICQLDKQPDSAETRSLIVFVCETAQGKSNKEGEYSGMFDTSDATLSTFITSGKNISIETTPKGFVAKYLINMEEIFTKDGCEETIRKLKELVCRMKEVQHNTQEEAALIEAEFSK